MSDFIEHLINRHLGKGEQVLPRTRARFEPDAGAALLPKDIEEDSQHITSPTPVVNPPGNEWVNVHDDWSSSKAAKLNKSFCGGPESHDMGGLSSPLLRAKSQELRANSKSPLVDEGTKQPVHDQPGPVIEPAEEKIKTIEREISRVPGEVDGNNNRVFPDKPVIPGPPVQKSVPKGEDGFKKMPAAYNYTIINENSLEYNIENLPDNNLQNSSARLLPPLEQDPLIRPEKPGNAQHLVTVITKVHEDSNKKQSHQHQPAAPEPSPSPVLPANLTEPGPVMVESQPVFTTVQNTGTGSDGLLEAPAWLSEKHSELHKGLFLKDSEAGAEPVVNITIGRIEVRANRSPAPEQPRQQKKPSGVMSLDQYLNQRTQGGNP